MRLTDHVWAGRFMAMLAVCLFLAAGLPLAGGAQAAPLFSVRPQYPDNHTDAGRKGYRLDVSPGQRQTLTLLVTNESDGPLSLSVVASDAVTGDNASIEYGTAPMDTLRLSDLVTVETPQLSLRAGETVAATLHIAVPDAPFAGSVLGGVSIRESVGASDEHVPYLLDIQLDQGADDPASQLALTDIEGVRLSDSRAQITFHIANPAQVALDPMALTVSVFASEKEVIPFYESHTRAGSMAPASQMRYTRDIALDLPAGEYWGKICIVYAGQTFEMAQPFSIRN